MKNSTVRTRIVEEDYKKLKKLADKCTHGNMSEYLRMIIAAYLKAVGK